MPGIVSAASAVDSGKIEAVIHLQRLVDIRDALVEIEDHVALCGKVEKLAGNDAGRQMAIEMLRLEVHRLRETYSREALRLSLTASVESGE